MAQQGAAQEGLWQHMGKEGRRLVSRADTQPATISESIFTSHPACHPASHPSLLPASNPACQSIPQPSTQSENTNPCHPPMQHCIVESRGVAVAHQREAEDGGGHADRIVADLPRGATIAYVYSVFAPPVMGGCSGAWGDAWDDGWDEEVGVHLGWRKGRQAAGAKRRGAKTQETARVSRSRSRSKPGAVQQRQRLQHMQQW